MVIEVEISLNVIMTMIINNTDMNLKSGHNGMCHEKFISNNIFADVVFLYIKAIIN